MRQCLLLAAAPFLLLAGCASAPAPRPTTAPGSPALANHAPMVRARCEPCRVAAGGTLTVTAEATDADSDGLSYAWTASAGTLTTPAAVATAFTAPAQPGAVPIVVTVRDTRGGIASDTITVTVTR